MRARAVHPRAFASPDRRCVDASVERRASSEERRRNGRPSGLWINSWSARAHVSARAQRSRASGGDHDVYTVMYGDTLAGVARAWGTSVETLCAANGIRFGDERAGEDAPALFVGQRLLIPSIDYDSWERERVGMGKSRGARAMSERERDAEFERARRVRSERRQAMAPVTRAHAVLSGNTVEELTRDEVAGLLAHRDVTVMLMCETNNCKWCEDARPAWTAVAVCYAEDPTVRVCRLRCDTDEMKQFAAKYFRAKTFPTIVALPAGKGPVYRHASTDRSVATLLEFAEEASGRSNASVAIDVTKPRSELTPPPVRQVVEREPNSAAQLAPPQSGNLFKSLNGAVGRALGYDRANVGVSVGTSVNQYSPLAASSNIVPIALGGLVTLAVFSAMANVMFAIKSVEGEYDDRRQPRRLGRHFDEERFSDDSEPMSDYEEAWVEVTEQGDMQTLDDWKSLVAEELWSLPGRAVLLIRIWFLIGRRKMYLGLWGDRRRLSRRGSRRSMDEYYDDDESQR